MSSKEGQTYSRYAIYFKPRAGSALADFEHNWFETAPSNQIKSPKKYGLHATLKPPFRLKDQRTFDELNTTINFLIGDFAPIDVGRLVQKYIGDFIALVPETNCPALDKLAFDWVRLIDPYRAPADAEEIKRRRTVSLNSAEEEMLQTWGYPYVDKCFRFHITLTGKLDKDEAQNLQPVLDDLLKPVLEEPVVIEDICLVGDPGDGAPFRLLERFPLTG